MRLLLELVVLIVVNHNNGIQSAKILAVFPTPSISHQVVFRPLTQDLAKRDHEVVVITTDPAFPKGQTPENLNEINVHDVSYKRWKKQMAANQNGNIEGVREILQAFTELSLEIFEEQTKVAEVQDIIKNNTFNLLIVEAWARSFLGFSRAIKAPVIAVSSFGVLYDNSEVVGALSHPLLYPQTLNNRIYNLSSWEKVQQYYHVYSMMNQHKNNLQRENAVIRQIFGESTPCLSELQNNLQILFLNIHPIWEGNRPVPPSVIYIGGIHQQPQKVLPEELQNYLDSSTYGVIYISFGTNVATSVLPFEKIQTIINSFSKLPYDILWKWDQNEMPGRIEKIRIAKWFPQSDLLRHPKIKLFITQGGLQSTEEAIAAGVPLIGIPMLGDHWYNAEKYVHHKIGTFIELKNLEEENFIKAVETIIENESYRENVMHLRTIMNDQPMSSLERAVWWTEHVLRHGGARHLRAPAANMPWTQYYEIELVLIVLSVAAAVIAVNVFILTKVLKLIFGQVVRSVKIKKFVTAFKNIISLRIR